MIDYSKLSYIMVAGQFIYVTIGTAKTIQHENAAFLSFIEYDSDRYPDSRVVVPLGHVQGMWFARTEREATTEAKKP